LLNRKGGVGAGTEILTNCLSKDFTLNNTCNIILGSSNFKTSPRSGNQRSLGYIGYGNPNQNITKNLSITYILNWKLDRPQQKFHGKRL
jgi:hypothetical protein